jgi:ketosteroid isomerase-like protein
MPGTRSNATDRHRRVRGLASLTLLASVASTADAQLRGADRGCAARGDASVAALHRHWILVGWERGPNDGLFDFREKLGRYYDWSGADVILYDDFDPRRRVVRSPAAYGAVWEPGFNAMRSARHRVLDGPHVLQSDGLAASTLVFGARLETNDGKVTFIRTFTSLVWRCTAEGWRIVREHNSSTVLPTVQGTALMRVTAAER